jgi:flagellum-specific peptidoglycan hydrolase FlgJ
VLVSELPAPPPPPSERERLDDAVAHLDVTPDLARSELQNLFLEAQHTDVLLDVASTLVQQDSDGFPGGSQGDFLRELAPSVLLAARDSAVPPSVTLAQAILESGWGQSSLARDANNLFGVKARSDEPSVRLSGGSRYRAYGSWEESLRDHNSLLATSPRYAAAQAHLDDWEAFLRALAPVYASSHTYVRSISGLVERYRLDRWDPLIREAADGRAS